MANRLMRLLRPRSVAVFGGRWARAVILSCQEMGYDGAIWPVHPSADEVCGLKAYRGVDELPDAPDASFIGINRTATLEVLAQLKKRKAGGAIAFASGFAETEDGGKLEQELIKTAGDMPILGPNCYGLINYLDGALLWPDVHGGAKVKRGVAIITQSSNLAITLTMQEGGLPIAYVVTLGNQAVVDMAELISGLASDERVTAIGLHIEGIKDAERFAHAVALARKAKKPIVALKAGASEEAQKLTLSHTASLAGAQEVASAFFRTLGVGEAKGVEAFMQALGLLHAFGSVSDKTLLNLSCSGGEASLIADAALRHGIELPALSAKAVQAIKKTTHALVTVSNPFDYHTFDWGDEARLKATFTAAMSKDVGVNSLVIDFPSPQIERNEDWHKAIRAWTESAEATGAKAVITTTLPECIPKEVASNLMERGIPTLRGFDNAMEAIGVAHDASKAVRANFTPLGLEALKGKARLLSETEAKAELASIGINIPQGIETKTLADALAFAEGKRVVMKATQLAHKSDEGGVLLNISTAEEVRKAWDRLSAKKSGSILVEEMIEDAVAEVIIGVNRDESFGLHMVLGAGGVMTELLQDREILMLPLKKGDAELALKKLRSAPLLFDKFRGNLEGDKEALLSTIEKVSDFAIAHASDLLEIDINPLLVRPKGSGVVAVDALIRYGSN